MGVVRTLRPPARQPSRDDGDRREWVNWGRNVSASPAEFVVARSTEDVEDAVRRARDRGLRIKPLGSGHSFTTIAVTDGVALDVRGLRGIESVVPAADGTVLVGLGGGTRLRDIGPALWSLGLAMRNMGDIDAQTLSGALSTGTHGTGAAFTGLTDQIAGLTIVTADGSAVACDPTREPELFAAARLGLGALGVMTTIVLRCVPAFLLDAVEGPGRLAPTLENWRHDLSTNDHYEFYWFPHTDRVHTKRNRRLPVGGDESAGRREALARLTGRIGKEVLENGVFELINRLTTRNPRMIPSVNRLSASVAGSTSHSTGRSYRMFVTPRRVRFRESEYAVPVERVPDLLRELSRWFERSDYRTAFPVEVRCAAADDVWLSTAFGRPTGYVAVHEYYRRDAEVYFRAFEAMARSMGGRPHWGKVHDRTAEDLAPSYPHFEDFRRVRNRWDPERVFDNAYLRRVLG